METPNNLNLKGNIEKLDVLRGVAIILVFTYHSVGEILGNFEELEFDGFLISPSNTLLKVLLNISPFGMGNSGVTLFLMLSGFLIHLGYLRAGQRIDWGMFYSKRFWRIYPAYLVALILFTVTAPTNFTSFDLISHLGMFHNLTEQTFFSINPSFWSLALEVQLYLLYPVYLFLRLRLGLNKSVLAVAGIMVVSTLVGHWVGLGESTVYFASVLTKWIWWVLGAFLGERYFHGKRLFHNSPTLLMVFFVLIAVVRVTALTPEGTPVMQGAFYVLLIDWYLFSDREAVSFSGYATKAIGFIGLCSYSIYLFHQPFLKSLIYFISPGERLSLVIGVLGAFLVTTFVGYLSYRVIELRFIKVGASFYRCVTAKYRSLFDCGPSRRNTY